MSFDQNTAGMTQRIDMHQVRMVQRDGSVLLHRMTEFSRGKGSGHALRRTSLFLKYDTQESTMALNDDYMPFPHPFPSQLPFFKSPKI